MQRFLSKDMNTARIVKSACATTKIITAVRCTADKAGGKDAKRCDLVDYRSSPFIHTKFTSKFHFGAPLR